MSRPAIAAAVAAERSATVAHLRAKAAEVEKARRWQLTTAERRMLARRLGNMADEIEAGMHVPD